jgi:hypothetical protein
VPSNVAVVAGSSVVLQCESDQLEWWNFAALTLTLTTECNINPSYNSNYNTTHDNGDCDLVILSAKPSVAGPYICDDSSADKAPQAAVIVLGKCDY